MNKKRYRFISVCLLCLALVPALAGCGGGGAASAPEMSIRESSASAEPAQAAAATKTYRSEANSLSFDYPANWTVSEDANVVTVLSAAEEDCGAVFADISYEISLFLAGRGDLETSVRALMRKYAETLAGGAALENYSPTVSVTGSNEIVAEATFSYKPSGGGGNAAYIGITQVGGRVILDLFTASGSSPATAVDAYKAIVDSLTLTNYDVPLGPANLSDLGFPEAPQGFYRFYNPVTGQFFIYPDDWELTSTTNDDFVALVNEYGAIMLMQNWTEDFYPIYNNNGNDIEECFDQFLIECADVLEGAYGQVRYSGFQYMSPKGNELIKAPFNYTLKNGNTGRCFAELSKRPMGGTDYIQGTMALYRPGDSYSIDMFSIIMDSTIIYYPEL